MYLLDTNIWIHFLNDTSAAITERIKAEDPASLYLTSINKAELVYGAYASDHVVNNMRKLDELFATLQSLPFDDSCTDHYGRLRAYLKRIGRPIGANDMLISAIALANNLTVVTANIREFSRVPGLRFENWEG